MKKQLLIIICTMALALSSMAQAPQGFSYQAVVRNAQGEPLAEQAVSVLITIQNEEGTITHYSESHSITTSPQGVINLNVGSGSPTTGVFADIPWVDGSVFLKLEFDPAGGTTYAHMGTAQLLAVPYALYANSASAFTTPPNANEEEPLFVVHNNAGQIVFAVYQTGVRIYVEDTPNTDPTKQTRGGFAIGGLSDQTKETGIEYMRVTPDSTRIYLRKPIAKATRGGFAVGGLSDQTKQIEQDFLFIAPDSARIYVNNSTNKQSRGGFAVGGLSDQTKGTSDFLYLTPENYFIGHNSGNAITTGLYNSALGYESGMNINSGESNSFVGYQSGYNNQIGSGNLFLGYRTGYSNTDGNYNSFLGYLAGNSNTTGTFNTFLGSFSGYSNTEGYNNTFVGDSTGYSNVSGYFNTFVGTGTGRKNVDGHENVYMGNRSGYTNISGERNVFIGNECGYGNLTGNDNVFLGTKSGYSSTNPWGNVFIGHLAGYYSLDPPANVFVGERSGYKNTVGGNNVFVGQWSGFENISGSHNVYLGWAAGYSDTTSIGNVFIGSSAGKLNQSGSENIFLGYFAGAKNNEGGGNIAIGTYAGSDTTLGDGNIFLGNLTGKKALGNNNIFLGSGTGHNTVGDNNIFIGNWAGADYNGSASLIIDIAPNDTNALIYGKFLEEKLWFNAQVKVNSASSEWDELIIEDSVSSSVLSLYGNGNEWQYSQVSLRSLANNATWSLNYNIDSTFAFEFYDGISTWETQFSIDTLGKVSILNNGMDINGNINPIDDDAYTLGTASKRWKEIFATNGMINLSDLRNKSNITNLDYGLNEIMKLRPVSFNWKGKEMEDKKIGLIAQEVDEVISEVVSKGMDELQTMGINYSDLIPVLIKGMQEQQKIIENQKSELESLNAEIEAIKSMLGK